MTAYTFRLPEELILALKIKAGLIPISKVLRRLVEKYINGEIDLD